MNSFHFTRDSKITVWVRDSIEVKAETLEEALDEVVNGSDYNIYDTEYLCETEETMSPSENNNQLTIEIYDGNTLVYDNVNGDYLNEDSDSSI